MTENEVKCKVKVTLKFPHSVTYQSRTNVLSVLRCQGFKFIDNEMRFVSYMCRRPPEGEVIAGLIKRKKLEWVTVDYVTSAIASHYGWESDEAEDDVGDLFSYAQ